MENSLETYKVRIKYYNGEEHIMEFVTPNLAWTMNQYQRNRDFLTWEVIEDSKPIVEDLSDAEIQMEKDIKNGLYGEEY